VEPPAPDAFWSVVVAAFASPESPAAAPVEPDAAFEEVPVVFVPEAPSLAASPSQAVSERERAAVAARARTVFLRSAIRMVVFSP
jgi:hypothetical protein